MNNNEIVIVGSSGCAKELVFLLKSSKADDGKPWIIKGFVDNENSGSVCNYPIVGNDDWLFNYKRELNVVIGIGDPKIKKRLAEKLQQNPFLKFPNIVSSTARIGDNVTLGKGCIICDMNILTVDIALGNFVTLNLNNTIGHDATIGSYVTINSGSHISGNVHVGEAVTIGAGTTVIQGLTIGDESIVGAGSVVIRDVNSRNTVVGNPVRVVKTW